MIPLEVVISYNRQNSNSDCQFCAPSRVLSWVIAKTQKIFQSFSNAPIALPERRVLPRPPKFSELSKCKFLSRHGFENHAGFIVEPGMDRIEHKLDRVASELRAISNEIDSFHTTDQIIALYQKFFRIKNEIKPFIGEVVGEFGKTSAKLRKKMAEVLRRELGAIQSSVEVPTYVASNSRTPCGKLVPEERYHIVLYEISRLQAKYEILAAENLNDSEVYQFDSVMRHFYQTILKFTDKISSSLFVQAYLSFPERVQNDPWVMETFVRHDSTLKAKQHFKLPNLRQSLAGLFVHDLKSLGIYLNIYKKILNNKKVADVALGINGGVLEMANESVRRSLDSITIACKSNPYAFNVIDPIGFVAQFQRAA